MKLSKQFIQIFIVFQLLIIVGVLAHGHDEPQLGEYGKSIFKQIKQFYEENFTSKTQQVCFSIFLVSFPSVPTFLMLVLIQKCYNKDYKFSNSLLNKLISFSVGTLLGDVLLHILPHLFEEAFANAHSGHSHGHEHHDHGHDHSHHHDHDHQDDHEHHHHDHSHGHQHDHSHSHGDLKIPFLICGGIIVFLILDFIFVKLNTGHSHDHGHNHSHTHDSDKKDNKNKKQVKESNSKDNKDSSKDLAAFTYLIGDMLHNVTDGLAVGAAFSNSLGMGLTTTFVVIIHELPHEMGDFAYLIKKHFGLFDILKTQIITSFGALIGGFIGIYAGEIYKTELLSLTAGGFLYMCLSQILPDVRESLGETKKFSDLLWTLVFMSMGIYSMYYITLIE